MENQKIALVTGGSRGIGKEISLKLARQGVDIIFTYLSNEQEAANTVAEIKAKGRKAIALKLDMTNVNSFDRFIERVQAELQGASLDYLINNAGTSIISPLSETTETQFDEMVNIHMKGVYFLTQKVLNILSDGGRIVNISSAISRNSFAGTSAYGMVKGAIDIYTKFLALELGKRGIAANVVAPGAIFGGGTMVDTAEMRSFVAGITALGRVGLPEDVGGVVAFLCSDDAKWINGQRIEVTGGMAL